MYSEKLKEEKLAFTVKEHLCSTYEVDNIDEIIERFCTREDVIGVPTDIVLSLFDDFCKENEIPLFSHLSLGRAFRKHFGLTRKKARNKDGELCWIYIPDGA